MQRRFLRAGLLLMVAGGVAAAACEPATRIQGSITLGSGKSSPDGDLHTLFVAAFAPTAMIGMGASASVNCTGNTPAWVVWDEFDAVRQSDFNPGVSYAMGGGKPASEVEVFSWWAVGSPALLSFQCPGPGTLFGASPQNPVFPGKDGGEGGAQASGIDVTLDRTL